MNWRSALASAICVTIVVLFFLLIVNNSVDIPNGDDLFCLLLFTQRFHDAASLTERFHLLFEQWVEHRILYSRLTALLSYWLTSHVNFVTIIMIGNASLIGFTLLFWKLIRRSGASMLYLVPVVFTLFSPVTYEANLWAGASTVYMPVGLLGLLTVYLLVFRANSAWGFLWPVLTALLATYSFGNGMFAFVAGAAVLIYQKHYREAAAWSAIGAMAVVLYFHDFEAYSGTEAFSFTQHFREPRYLVYNFLGFVGGILDYTENVNRPVVAANIPALLFGLSIVGLIGRITWLFLFRRRADEPERLRDMKTAWLGMAAFVLITALAMTYARTLGSAMNTMTSRYKIYSMIFWMLAYWGCLIQFKRKKAVGICFGVISFAILFLSYYTHYDKLTNYKSSLLSGLFNYNRNGKWVIYRHTSFYEGASKVLCDSITRNNEPVYAFNPVFPQLTRQAISKAPTLRNVEVSASEDCLGHEGKCLSIRTNEYPSVSNYFKGIYLVIYNEADIYLFVATPWKNGRFNMFTNGSYYKPGFYLDNNFDGILKPGGHYKLAVFCPTEKQQIKLIPYNWNG